MVRFRLEGFYQYNMLNEGRGRLTGEIDVLEKGSFEGEIIDHASRTPHQFLSGHLIHQESLDRLSFLKFPPATDLADLAYELEKKSDGSFEGTYTGRWGALPYKVKYFEENGLYVARVDMSLCELGDEAEITLSRF